MHTIPQLAEQVGAALQSRKLLLTTAESCTGGGVGQAITDIAGSSGWYERGFITYSNAAKSELLNVPEALLVQFGAVSEEVASAMATGALANSHAQVALSTTGIAGPGGAVPGKPVGTVCFAWALKYGEHGQEQKLVTERLVFSGDRHAVREQSVAHALQGLLHFLEQQGS